MSPSSPVGATPVDWIDNRTWLCRACGATGLHKVDHDCPVGATDSPKPLSSAGTAEVNPEEGHTVNPALDGPATQPTDDHKCDHVEAVARAIAIEDGYKGGGAPPYYRRLAVAAIAALDKSGMPVNAHEPSDPNCVKHRRELDTGRTCGVCARYDNATWLTQRECFEAGCS